MRIATVGRRGAAPAPGEAGLADQRRGLDLEPRAAAVERACPFVVEPLHALRGRPHAGRPRRAARRSRRPACRRLLERARRGRRSDAPRARRARPSAATPHAELRSATASPGRRCSCIARRRTARRRRAGRSSRSLTVCGSKRASAPMPGGRGAGFERHRRRRVEGQAEAGRVAAFPGQASLRRRHGRPRDERADRRRRRRSMRRLRRAGGPPRKAWLVTASSTGVVGRTRPLDRRVDELGDGAGAASRWPHGGTPAGSSASATIMSIAADVAGLRPPSASTRRRKHRAGLRELARCLASTLARAASNCAVLSGGAAPAAVGAAAAAACRCWSSWRVRCASWCSFSVGAAPRVGEDLRGPGERRLAIERRAPDAPQAGVARPRSRASAQAMLAPLLHRRLDERRPAVLQPLGQRRPGLGEHAC